MIDQIEIAEIPLKIGAEIKKEKIRVFYDWVLVKICTQEEVKTSGGIILAEVKQKQLEQYEFGTVLAMGKLAKDYLLEEYPDHNILGKGDTVFVKKNSGVFLDVLGGIKTGSLHEHSAYRYVPVKEILFCVLHNEV